MLCNFRDGGNMLDGPYRLFDGRGEEMTAQYGSSIYLVNTETGVCEGYVEPFTVTAEGELESQEIRLVPPLKLVGASEVEPDCIIGG